MKLLAKILFILFFACNAYAVDIGQSDIPYNISSGGTYELTESVTYAGGTAITIATSSAVILRGKSGVAYSITVSGGHGIYSNNDYADLTIYDLDINQNHAGAAIWLANSTGSKSVTIHDLTIDINLTTAGAEVSGIKFDGGNATMSGSIYDNVITFSGSYSGTNRSSAIAGTGPSSDSTTRFDIYSNTLNITGHLTNGIRFYGGNYYRIRNNDITADSSSDNTKSIQIDGGASNQLVYSNTIDVNSNDTTSGSYGLRVRFGASNNEFYSNNINISDSTGSYGCSGISLGGDEGTESNGNIFYSNTVVGSGTANIPIVLYNASGDGTGNAFYWNTITNSGTGVCVSFFPVTSSTPVQNLSFKDDTFSSAGSYIFSIPSYADEGALVDVVICNDSLSDSDVNDADSVGGWTVNPGDCSDVVPVDTDATIPAGTTISTGVTIGN